MEHVEEGEPDRPRIGWLLPRLSEQERNFERLPPHGHKESGHVLEHRSDQLRESGEGEQGLGLRTAVREHSPERRASLLHTRLPQHRLADPRLSRKHERGRPVLNTLKELPDRAKLAVAPNERRGDVHRGIVNGREPADYRGKGIAAFAPCLALRPERGTSSAQRRLPH